MAKSIRIDNERIHEELTQLFLNLQSEKGHRIKMEDLLEDMIKVYNKRKH
ncbi:MAG: hypothetical protein ABI342_09760 [Nitrososphaera sp.]|jgi:hypothetical protein